MLSQRLNNDWKDKVVSQLTRISWWQVMALALSVGILNALFAASIIRGVNKALETNCVIYEVSK